MKSRVLGSLIVLGILLVAFPPQGVARTDDTPAKQPPAKDEAAPPAGESPVTRAVFTTDVVDHEPVDELEAVPADRAKLYFFTELTGLEGELVTHRWMLDGETVAEVPIQVRGPRWRAYSVKELPEGSTGPWVVVVVDDEGSVLHRSEIAAVSTEVNPGR